MKAEEPSDGKLKSMSVVVAGKTLARRFIS